MPDALATPAQVAEFLQVTPEALRQWAHRGEGPPSVKITGQTRRYDWAEVLAWVEEKKGGRR